MEALAGLASLNVAAVIAERTGERQPRYIFLHLSLRSTNDAAGKLK
jgi:hypothetical protein